MATIIEPIINTKDGVRGVWRQAGRGYGRSDTGYFQNFVIEGTEREIEALAGSYDAAGATYEVTYLTGRRARLSARTGNGPGGGSETAEDVWELSAQDTQKDLLDSDFTNGGFATLTAVTFYEKQVIQRALSANISLATAYAQIVAETPGVTIPAVTDNAKSMFRLMLFGVRAFPIEASIIRHTQTVNNVWSAYASFSNVNRILSNSAMDTLEGAGDLFLFSLPTIPTATQYIETAGDLQYGWRKIRPSITRLTYNKWQITNVYQFGLWAVKLYGALI